jgi:hypothetical protein
MKNAKEFIISELSKMYKSIDNLELRYQNIENEGLHMVEIMPQSIFDSNKDYINLEMDLKDLFIDTFPLEELMFISQNSLTKIDSPDFELIRSSISVSISDRFDFSEWINVNGGKLVPGQPLVMEESFHVDALREYSYNTFPESNIVSPENQYALAA